MSARESFSESQHIMQADWVEAAERLWVVRHIIRQELECDETTKIGVLRFVDDTHSAAAEFFYDTVMGNDLVEHEWRRDSFE